MKLILLLITLGFATTLADDTQLLKTFSDALKKFIFKIYDKYEFTLYGGNVAMCPTSLNLMLGVICAGVKGNSAKNITNSIQKLNAYLNFDNVNKIYINDGFQISNTYKSTLVDIFKGDIDNIDFKQLEKYVGTVNSRVYENSNHLIDKIITKNNLNERSKMLMINTANFRGLFAKNLFKETSTFKRNFYIDKKKSVQIDMMAAFCNCLYYESKELDARFLQLNFTNIVDGSITFILPNAKNGLENLESKIKKGFIKPNYSNQYVHIFIPRFKIEFVNFDYNFQFFFGSNNVHLTGISTNQEPLELSYIGQKVIVEVNENGANITWTTYSMLDSIDPNEAEASGGRGSLDFDFDFYLGSSEAKPNIFEADHPFIYYITINDAYTVVGKFAKPEVGNVLHEGLNFSDQSANKIKSKTKLGSKNQLTEAAITNIVDEYTCPCNLN